MRVVTRSFSVLAVALTFAVAPADAEAGRVTAVTPARVSADATLNISATGLDVVAANNRVTFTPPGGAAIDVVAMNVGTVDAMAGVRRIGVRVPRGLPAGAVSLRVTNTATGEVSDVVTVEIVVLQVAPASLTQGSGPADVVIRSSPNGQFAATGTRVVFGTGVTVHSLRVDSPTQLTVSVTVSATAPLGTLSVATISSGQTAFAPDGFEIRAPGSGSSNVAPTVQIAPVAPVTLPAGTTLMATVQDDGLPNPPGAVQFTWSQVSGPSGGVAIFGAPTAATTPVTFAVPGTYGLRLTASDGALSTAADVTVEVKPAVPTNTAPTVDAGPAQTVTLPATALLSGTVTDDGLPQGAPLTITWTKADGPGIVTFANVSSANTSATFSAPGLYTLRLTASDTQFTVSDDVGVTVSAPSLTNLAPTVDAGPDSAGEVGAPIDLAGAVTDDGRVSATPALSWAKLTGPGTVTFASPSSAQTTASFDVAGVYVLQLSADDGEFVSADTTTVTVTATATSVADRAPPIVALIVPREAVPGAEVEVRVEASDNVGVASVRVEIDGQPPADIPAAPFTRRFTVPQVAVPGTTLTIVASVRDAAGNVGRDSAQLTITSSPDTESPAVQISGPQATSPGAAIRLSAIANDNVGVDEVTFLLGGEPIGSGRMPPYRASHLVPVDAAVGSMLTVTARARDFAGNEAESVLQVLVEAVADTTPPTVSLDVPGETFPGALLPIAAMAADAGGIASVEFAVDEARLATRTVPPYTASYRVPTGQVPGTTIAVVATATDFASFTATAAASVRVVAPPLVTRGVVTGEVYDDTTGLPLAGARVVMEGVDALGVPFAGEAITDARGRYLLRGSAGEARLRITRAGFTRVDRKVVVQGGQAVSAFDARLTPVAAFAGRVSLTMLAGSLPGGVTLVPVSGQGLQGLLPLGWSPVGVADLWPHTASLTGAGTLRVTNALGLGAGAPLALARFDEAVGAWRALGSAAVSSSGQWLEATVSATGQYAFLVADVLPQAPPAAVAGQLLGGVDQASLPATLATAIDPEPRILFHAPDVSSTVTGRVTATTPMTSGLPLVARVTESYRFVSGDELHPEPYEADLVFYQAQGAGGATASEVAAAFVASPSHSFEALSLDRGVITVELVAEGAGAAPRGLVTSGGGVVDGPGGLQLVLPAGAVSDPTPLSLVALTASPVRLPDVVTFVAGAGVQVDRALARGGVLSMPVPAGLADASRVVLVRVAQLGGQTRLLLVGLARIEAGRLVADTRVNGQATALDGILEPGQYLFLRVAEPIGFVGGVVRGVGGATFAGALVTSNSLPIVSLSTPLGAYLAVARVGTTAFTARDLVKNDAGSAQAFVLANQVLPLGLQLVAVPPQVTSISPADGATGVALGSPVVVTFSEPIDPASVSGANLANVLLRTAAGDPVVGTASLSSNNSTLTFRPSAALAPDAAYTFLVATGVRDMAGYGLPAPVSVSFATIDTTPPPPPAAGTITASIPDAQGRVTVSATQGTADPRYRVFVDNLTRRTTAVALVEANGSFATAIVAGLTDKLRVRIVDGSGNETVQEIEGFRQVNADGSVSQVVGPDGGIVEGPAGTRASIRPDTFPQGAVVTLRAVPPSAFPKPLTPEQAERIEFESGVGIDFGGAEPTKYVDVGVAPRGGETERDRWVLVQFVEDENGAPRYEAVDTARLIDGRITTSSPPCPGVTAAGTYGFMRPRFDQVGVNWARVPADSGSITVDIFNVFGSLTMLMPWNVTFNPVKPTVCFPAFTGDVTVTANTAILTVPGSELTPSDRMIEVRVGTAKESFPRNYPEFVFDVEGTVRDDYSLIGLGVTARSALDEVQQPVERPMTAFTVTALDATRVRLRTSPDRVKYLLRQVVVVNLTRDQRHVFPISAPDLELPVTGGPSASYTVIARDADNVGRAVVGSSARPSPYGDGNLLVRARPGSIDPTREEMNQAGVSGPARTGLQLTGPEVSLDLHGRVVQGGFDVAFTGTAEGQYALTTFYDERPPFLFFLPRFRVVARNTLTGKVVRTIEAFMPPPDEPRALGEITDDTIAPYVISGPTRLQSFDPSGTLTFTFSEPMDPDSLQAAVVVLDSQGRRLRGRVQVSGGGRVVTFYPSGGLQLGEQYEVTISSAAQDRAGNAANPVTLRIRTFTPRVVSSVTTGHAFKDVALVRKTVNERVTTTAFATTGAASDASSLLAIDVTDAASPRVVGAATPASPSRQKIVVLEGVEEFTGRTGTPVSGDLAITTTFNVNTSYVSFYDVNDPTAPKDLGLKVLTVNPDLAQGASQFNTTFATGFAKGVAALRTERGVAAYAAVERVGLMGAELADNIPTRPASERLREGLYPGDFVDLASFQTTLLAVSRRDRVLTLVSPNLGPLSSVPFAPVPNRVVVVEGLAFDGNNDGFIDPEDVFDLAVVGASDGVHVIDIRNVQAPVRIGYVALPGNVRELAADGARRRAFVAYDDPELGPALGMVDITDPTQRGLVDLDANGVDDRLIWRQAHPKGVNGLRFEPQRGLLYVSTPADLEIWAVYDICCDLGVDLEAVPTARLIGETETILKLERKALAKGIAQGLEKAVAQCGLRRDQIRMFESGSSACIWDDNSVKTCDGNYQPGVSDHDISTFFDDALFPTSGEATVVLCTLRKLTAEFTDEKGKPVPVVVDGREVRFEDISFLPNRLSWWRTSVYGLDRTDPSIPGDADNTLGMAMQFLLLKHATEARWVRVPGWESLKDDLDFEDALRKMRNATFDFVRGGPLRLEAMSPVEAYETANLMEFNLYKSKMYVRVKGATDERSAFNGLLIKQLHNAAKAGIRATLAKMIAHPKGLERLLGFTRRGARPGESNPLKPLLVFESNACLTIDPGRDVTRWADESCESLEEYIASAAARTRRWWGIEEPPLDLFTDHEIKFVIPRFYRIKADLELIDSDEKADEFLAMTHRWVKRMVEETEAIYQLTIVSDPRRAQREDNMAYKRSRILVKQKGASLDIVPRVFNRGFTDAPNVKVTMYTADAEGPYTRGAEEVVFLSGGTEQELEYKRRPDGEFERDERGEKIRIFAVKNIDQTLAAGQTRRVVFTIDLPDRSVKEAYRENNIGGFFWYLLDTANAQTPSTAATVPAPFSGSELARLLAPDAECVADPRLAIDQFITYKGEVQPNPAFIVIDEAATYTMKVSKPDIGIASDVTACETLTGRCHPVGTVATVLPGTVQLPLPTDKALIFDVVPTAYSPDTGIQRGSPLRVVVSCERYALTAVAPDSALEPSRIMQGGRSYRHFRVTDRLLKGPPASPVTVTLTLSGPASYAYSFTTNAAGVVGRQIGTEESPRFEPGVSFVYDEGMPAGVYRATVEVIKQNPRYCGAASTYEAELLPFTYTEAVKAGASLSVGIGNPFKKLKFLDPEFGASLGGGLSLSLDVRRLDGQRTDTAFEIGRYATVGVEAKGKFEADLTKQKQDEAASPSRTRIRNKGRVRQVRASAEGAGVEAEAGLQLLHGDAHKFTLPLDTNGSKALAALVFETALETAPGPAGWFMSRFAKALRQRLTDVVLPKTSENYLARLKFEADGQVTGIEVLFAKRNEQTKEHTTRARVKSKELALGVKMDAGLEWQRRFAGEDNPVRDIAGLRAEGELTWTLPFETSLEGAKNEIDAGPGDVTTKELKKTFLDELQEKLQGVAEGAVGGGVELRLHTDPSRDNEPVELEIRFLGPLAYAYPPAGGGGTNEETGETTTKSLRFRIESKEQMGKVLETVASASALLDAGQKTLRGIDANRALETGPSVVYELLVDFVKRVLDFAAYDVPVMKGVEKPYNLDLSLLASLAARVPLDSSLDAQFRHEVAYPLERGRVVGGVQYKLEDYAAVQPGRRDFFKEFEERVKPGIQDVERDVEGDGTETTEEPGDERPEGGRKPPKKKVRGPEEPTGEPVVVVEPEDHEVEIETYPIEDEVGPTRPRRRHWDDTERPKEKPGPVGRVVRIRNKGASPQPVKVTIRHKPGEIPPPLRDPTKVRPHVIDPTGVPRPHPGTYDPVRHEVSATVVVEDEVIIVTAPIEGIPVGPILLRIESVERLGSGANLRTRVRFTSQAIAKNDGVAMNPGEIVHVLSVEPEAIEDGLPIPAGTILSTDAQPETDGHQVALDGAGRIDMTVEYPGDPFRVRIIAFSDEGVAKADVTLPVPRP